MYTVNIFSDCFGLNVFNKWGGQNVNCQLRNDARFQLMAEVRDRQKLLADEKWAEILTDG